MRVRRSRTLRTIEGAAAGSCGALTDSPRPLLVFFRDVVERVVSDRASGGGKTAPVSVLMLVVEREGFW